MTPSFFTRRDFLRTGALGGALSTTVPAFLSGTMQQLAAEENGLSGKDDSIVVVIQLAGGNDGLNTIVPTGDDHYYRARPNLSIKAKDCIKLDDDFGLNRQAAGFQSLWDDGQLGIIHGVGYPNPNRSHFRSTEIWQTACDSDKTLATGWIGRYFDNHCQGSDPGAGISITRQAPQSFSAKDNKGITFDDPSRFRFSGLEDGDTPEEEFFLSNNSEDGSSINMLAGSGSMMQTGTNALDFLERTAMDAQVSSEKIETVLKAKSTGAEYPRSPFAQQLKLISQLIAGGMHTRIYYAERGGFDTHANQAASHPALLADVAASLKTFQADLTKQGNDKRVTTLVFTEFGRRVKENASGGTDHGAAGPAFVIGGRVVPGFHGAAPDLAPQALLRGDPRYTTDFRSVYQTLVDQALGADGAAVLGQDFGTLPLLKS